MKKVYYQLIIIIVKFIKKSNVGKHNRLLTTHIYKSEIGNYNYIGPGVIINNAIISIFAQLLLILKSEVWNMILISYQLAPL